MVVDYDLTFLKKLEGIRTYSSSPLTEIKHSGLDNDTYLWVKGNNLLVLINVVLMRQINAIPLFGMNESKIKGKKFQPVKVLVNEFENTRKYFTEYVVDGDTFISLKIGEKSVKYYDISDKLPEFKVIYSVEASKDGKYLIILANSHKNIYKGEKVILVVEFNYRMKVIEKQILSVKIPDFLPSVKRVRYPKMGDVFVVNLSDCICLYKMNEDGKIFVSEIINDEIQCKKNNLYHRREKGF